MSIRHTQSLRLKPTVSPQLVLANELLQFSSLELEQAIAHELAENPALELMDTARCPGCGSEMSDGQCPWCGVSSAQMVDDWADRRDFDPSQDYGAPQDGAGEDWEDPVSRLASQITLTDHLLHQARLSLPHEDMTIAAHLIESLDDRGFLRCDLDEVASVTGVRRGDVERVLSVVQALDPVGVGSRDARECLLIQLEQLREEGVMQPLAEHLIGEHWDLLGRCSSSRVAEEVGVPVDEVCEALRFIRENLNPYPAYTYWAGRRSPQVQDAVVCPQPDVILRERGTGEGGYEIELPKARMWRFRVSPTYRRALNGLGGDHQLSDQRGCEQWQGFQARARLFVKSIEQRWRTLYELMGCLVECQRDFLAYGEMRLIPLTRARVAEIMDVHESTVSRAVAGKHVQLPGGEVVPLDKFFDSAAPIKRIIEELVKQEDEPLSDGAIADILCEHGHDVARRTVAKYRSEQGILPCSLRRWERDLSS